MSRSRPLSPLPPLFLIADAPTCARRTDGLGLVGVVERALGAAQTRGHVAVVDRDRPPSKGGPADRERLRRLQVLRGLTAERGAALVVTGRVDLALACGADGVQLPERGLSVDCLGSLRSELAVGRSCHDAAGVRAASHRGADWVLLAPVFAPLSKAGAGAALGLEGFASLARITSTPVIALGGMTPENAALARSRGAAAVASLGSWLLAADPEASMRALLQAAPTPVSALGPS